MMASGISMMSLPPPVHRSSSGCSQPTKELHLSHRWSSKPCKVRARSWPLLHLELQSLEMLVQGRRESLKLGFIAAQASTEKEVNQTPPWVRPHPQVLLLA
jgi:hypothetical protein